MTRGFTIVEATVSLGIAAVVFLSVGAGLQQIGWIRKSKEIQAEINELIKETQEALHKDKACTENFKNKNLVMNGDAQDIDIIRSYDDGGNPRDTILQINREGRRVQVADMKLAPIAPVEFVDGGLEVKTMAAELMVEFRSLGENPRSYVRKIGLNFNMANNLTASCAKVASLANVGDRTCELLSNNLNRYDANTDSCVPRFVYQTEEGDPDQAECPSGWQPRPPEFGSPCNLKVPQGYKDQASKYWNEYAKEVPVSFVAPGSDLPSTTKVPYYTYKLEGGKCVARYVTEVKDGALPINTLPNYATWMPEFQTTIVCVQNN